MPRARRIPTGDFVEFAPRVVDEQVNINHENCTAGIDRKSRLYIKRTNDGIVAYCHNCGLGGYYINGVGRVRKRTAIVAHAPSGEVYTSGSFGAVSPVTTGHNKEWVDKFISGRGPSVEPEVRAYLREVFSSPGNPLMFPMVARNATIYGWQLRYTDGRMPKCKTYINAKSIGGWYGNIKASCAVVVEDPLSAVIVSKTMGTKVAVHCLFGTKLSEMSEVDLITEHNRVVVWLDPDKAGVDAAAKITKRLTFMQTASTAKKETHNITQTAGIQPKDSRDIANILEPYV